MTRKLGDPIPRKGYVHEIQYRLLGEEGRDGGRIPFRSCTPHTRKVFTPWPDPRSAITALEGAIVDESRKSADALIAEYGDPKNAHVMLVHAIEVVSVTRVVDVDEIFGFDFVPSYSPLPPTEAGVAP